MIHFLKLMLELSKYELAIARKYSDNRKYISDLSRDVLKWEGELIKFQIRNR